MIGVMHGDLKDSNFVRITTVLAAIAAYVLFYFVLCDIPVVGVPTFRIDYYWASVTRGDELKDLSWAIFYTRPVTALYAVIQGVVARNLFGGEARYIIYLVQHAVVFIGFFSAARAVESIFKMRLHFIALLCAWLSFMTTMAVFENVYKLETIVGTMSLLFGSLSLLFIVRWQEAGGRWSAFAALACYALSIFSKEDFILPPLLLLVWYLLQDKVVGQRAKLDWRILAGFVAIVVFFVAFNKFLTQSERSFITGVKDESSPYYMTLNPIVLFKTALQYGFGFGSQMKNIFIAYVAASFFALAFRRKWKETLLVGLIVGGLMGPYLIMPNHLYSYYGVKWIMWQTLLIAMVVQLFISNTRQANIIVASMTTLLVIPTVTGVLEHKSLLWHSTEYLRNQFNVSRNVRETVIRYRSALNAQKRVAVVGIGPGQIDNAPWQSNGETAYYITGDLGLSPNWVVYVRSERLDYKIDPVVPGATPTARVTVRSIKDLANSKESHALIFDKTGRGKLVSLRDHDLAAMADELGGTIPYSVWLASPDLKASANPQTMPVCTDKPAAVEITWDVTTKVPNNQIEIWVGADGQRKLWLAGLPKGSAKTGAWVKSGVRFDLEEAATHGKLSSITIGGTACR